MLLDVIIYLNLNIFVVFSEISYTNFLSKEVENKWKDIMIVQ